LLHFLPLITYEQSERAIAGLALTFPLPELCPCKPSIEDYYLCLWYD